MFFILELTFNTGKELHRICIELIDVGKFVFEFYMNIKIWGLCTRYIVHSDMWKHWESSSRPGPIDRWQTVAQYIWQHHKVDRKSGIGMRSMRVFSLRQCPIDIPGCHHASFIQMVLAPLFSQTFLVVSNKVCLHGKNCWPELLFVPHFNLRKLKAKPVEDRKLQYMPPLLPTGE